MMNTNWLQKNWNWNIYKTIDSYFHKFSIIVVLYLIERRFA